MIDLSALQIPDESVVPDPTADLITGIMSLASTAIKEQRYDHITQVMIYFARRCRELEAGRKADGVSIAWQAERFGDMRDEIVKLQDRDRQAVEAYAAKCETQKFLEAETERLRIETEKLSAALAGEPYDG